MENLISSFIFCHDQKFILNSLNTGVYNILGEHNFLYLGYGDIDLIKHIKNLIVSRDCNYNIELNKNCLQYCGWYSLHYNNLIKSKYVRLIDYDIIIKNANNSVPENISSTVGFDFDFYFKYGFGESNLFLETINKLSQSNVDTLINQYIANHNQRRWFSSIDIIIKTELFKDFMEWFYKIYDEQKNNFYFGMHFERYLTAYCLINNIRYDIRENETVHDQKRSHIYY